jgi:thymidylate synthase
MLNESFHNAKEAFESLFFKIINQGIEKDGTKLLYNVGFNIENPMDNKIDTPWRKWSENYAKYEWQWYLSGDPNAEQISQRANIWKSMMNEYGNVNSNYGYQWNRNDQLKKAIKILKDNPDTRKASISLYDGKEIHLYKKDTVCTYAINFYRDQNGFLSMQVMMRSNDLVLGFCNDQYCFSKLQEMVSIELGWQIGSYYHFTCNMHIYQRHFDLFNKIPKV